MPATDPQERAKVIKSKIEDLLFKYWEILQKSKNVKVENYTKWNYQNDGPGYAIQKIFKDIERIENE